MIQKDKIVLMCPYPKFAEVWAKAIHQQAPEIAVEVYPNDTHREETQFMLAFLPEDGVFSQYPNLKVVASMGAGVRFILNNKGLSEKVTITRIIEAKHQRDMADFTLALILNYMRRLMVYTQYKAQKKWHPHSYKRPEETTVGIMGIGAIGQAIGGLLVQNGFTVTGWSRSPKELTHIRTYYGDAQRNEFLQTAEILVCVLPLTDETTGILNASVFAQLPKGAYLINLGRGAELVETDLLAALESGQLAGAALDVFQKEPLPENHPFWTHKKIMITPHTAGSTHPESAVKSVLHNYYAMKEGTAFVNEVSRARGY